MKFLMAAERSTLLDAIREQLADEPLVETRNRKPLRPNPLAPWELRVGSLRAFYDVRPLDPRLEALPDVVYVSGRWQEATRSNETCSGSPGR
jgi:hypothetical protein